MESTIRVAVLIQLEPDPKQRLANRHGHEEKKERANVEAEELEQRGCAAEPGSAEMDREKHVMEVPCGYAGRADQHAGVGRQGRDPRTPRRW